MSEKRIPCPNCGVAILEVTAKYNAGLCAPCNSNRKEKERLRREAEAARNAPPPPINYSSFTEREFVDGLTKACRPHRDDPDEVSSQFLGFCDPILQARPLFGGLSFLFSKRALFKKLTRIPRPFRELMAVYQAWGMVASDGFYSYVDQTDPKFDTEVDLGLLALGYPAIRGVVSEARRIAGENDGDIPDEAERRLWARFYEPMGKFESAVLGPRLVEVLFDGK